MTIQILLGFLPWILFSALYGTSEKEMIISLLVSSLVFLKTEWSFLKKGFILSWGTLLFFAFIFIFGLLLKISWVIHNAILLSNVALALIAWASLLIGKSFTLQYAREQTPPQFWNKPGFIKVNQILTAVWGIVFLISAGVYILPFGDTKPDQIIYQVLMYGSIAFGIWFTKVFPAWYRAHEQKIRNQNNFYLQGNYAPIREENDFENLSTSGKIPEDLNGAYMRNGPNPAFEPISYSYPFDGDGMIHAIYLENGKARYRNRYVKTKGLLLEQRYGKAIYGGLLQPLPIDPKIIGPNDEQGPFKNGAFIHVIRQANHYLAMSEGAPAYEINFNLETLGEWHAGTPKPINVGPHTRFDSKTGELFLIDYEVEPPYLICHRVDREGQLIESTNIDKPYSTMMHDFVMTENYLIFFDCPAVLNLEALTTGGNVLQWRKELGTKIGIMHRHDKNKKIIWLTTEAFFVFHFVNSYEKNNNEIIVDYIRHKSLDLSKDKKDNTPPKLYRMQIDLDKKILKETQLSDHQGEFPTFNRNYDTQTYRFAYAPTRSQKNEFDALVKYDLEKNTTSVHDFGEKYEIGEAFFAPRLSANSEDDGYLMLFVYDKTKNSSDFVILDAKNISDKPIAKISLPRRVPNGLHGSWFEKF